MKNESKPAGRPPPFVPRVALFREGGGPGLDRAETTLTSAGYLTATIVNRAEFINEVPASNCAVVLAPGLAEDLLPDRFDRVHVPPIVLISPLSQDQTIAATRDGQSPHRVIPPTYDRPALVGCVTAGVVSDIMRRATYGIRKVTESQALVEAVTEILQLKRTRVKSIAADVERTPRTLQKHYSAAFGDHEYGLAGLCSATLLLYGIATAAAQRKPIWTSFAQHFGVSLSVLRRASMDFLGQKPSELRLTESAGEIVGRVCSGGFPERLLRFLGEY